MLLVASSARALLRAGAPVGRLARRAASTAADEQLEAVKVTIDQRLRDALRLPGKQRRPRCSLQSSSGTSCSRCAPRRRRCRAWAWAASTSS